MLDSTQDCQYTMQTRNSSWRDRLTCWTGLFWIFVDDLETMRDLANRRARPSITLREWKDRENAGLRMLGIAV